MTEELKQKAEEWVKNHIGLQVKKYNPHIEQIAMISYIAGATEATKELQEKVKDQVCEVGTKEEVIDYAKSIIKSLLDNSDEYAEQRAIEFLKESECN